DVKHSGARRDGQYDARNGEGNQGRLIRKESQHVTLLYRERCSLTIDRGSTRDWWGWAARARAWCAYAARSPSLVGSDHAQARRQACGARIFGPAKLAD